MFRMSLIPNPATGKTELQLESSEQGVAIVRLKNVMGQTIMLTQPMFMKSGSQTQEINLEGIPAGMYFLEIYLNEKVISVEKLVKT